MSRPRDLWVLQFCRRGERRWWFGDEYDSIHIERASAVAGLAYIRKEEADMPNETRLAVRLVRYKGEVVDA